MKRVNYTIVLLMLLCCFSFTIHQGRPIIVYGGHTDTWNLASYEPLEEPLRTYYTKIIAEEMAKYPDEFYEKIGLEYIVLVKDLKFDIDYRAAIPDKKKNILFMGVRDGYEDEYVRHCFHHEQNHFTEYALWNDYRYNWDKWAELYTGGREGGEIAYRNNDRTVGDFRSDLIGFLNRYSALGQEEDRAEIMAYFMTDSKRTLLIEKAKNDRVLNEKALLLFELYATELYFPNLLKQYKEELSK